MTGDRRASLEEIRGFYARLMSIASRSDDPRIERAFELVPREAFLPPGPWRMLFGRTYVETPSADPVYLYQNALFALDAAKGIHNGQPSLHAAWIGAVSPQPGEAVCQIGAGTGYYTAILSLLVQPHGRVVAFEHEPTLAAQARANLASFERVSLAEGDATAGSIPQSHVIYVNAGVTAPPRAWLAALKPGGRMIFPWQPTDEFGLALIVRPAGAGFSVEVLMPSRFIACTGASKEIEALRIGAPSDLRRVASLHLTARRPPDETAVAVYPDIWFSTAPPALDPEGPAH